VSFAYFQPTFPKDKITEGTVTTDTAIVVDANKDISGFRNVTISGNLTVSGTIPGYVSLATLKAEVAASTDFADFKTRIAAL